MHITDKNGWEWFFLVYKKENNIFIYFCSLKKNKKNINSFEIKYRIAP